MSRAPRLFGYALMAIAAALAIAMRSGGIEKIGPVPAIAAALLAGMIGVMLVFTDLMVRGMFAQLGARNRGETGRDNDDKSE